MKYESLRKISYLILFIAFLMIYSFAIRHVWVGGKQLGVLTKPLREFSKFPRTVYDVFEEVKFPEKYFKADPKFEALNNLSYDVYALNGHYDHSRWIIRLINLRNDSVLHEWFLQESDWKSGKQVFAHSGPRDPILLEDRSIILSGSESKNLHRLDKESNIIWHNTDFQYHHGINKADDGNIWACSKNEIYTRTLNNKAVKYLDNSLTKIDVNTGETLVNISVTQILIENGYEYLIHGMGNTVATSSRDPLHLNDIEPVLQDGPYWKKGDLFLSFRHKSLIILYRPETNQILRLIHGPFLNQHDVDILSETKISLFNNNRSSLKRGKVQDLEIQKFSQGSLSSEIVIYDFEDSTFISHMTSQFQAENIRTGTQGLHTILKNGDVFVESQNQGKIFIINEHDVLLRKYCNSPVNNMVERPHWVRIYEDIDF